MQHKTVHQKYTCTIIHESTDNIDSASLIANQGHQVLSALKKVSSNIFPWVYHLLVLGDLQSSTMGKGGGGRGQRAHGGGEAGGVKDSRAKRKKIGRSGSNGFHG